METLVEQARRLSSGTIASLTGVRHYKQIDIFRAEFVDFCELLDPKPEKWQDAWIMFWRQI